MNFDTDVDKADAPGNLVINANNPDLRKFIARGGKLMLIGGWNDHTLVLAATWTITKAWSPKLGARMASTSVRLFMVPGMDHCLGESYPTAPIATSTLSVR